MMARGLCVSLLLVGCAAPFQPPPPLPPPRLDDPLAQCETMAARRRPGASLAERREHLAALAAFQRAVPIHLVAEVLSAAEARQRRHPPLDGEAVALRLRVRVQGAQIQGFNGFQARPYLVVDGTRLASIVSDKERLRPSGEHDLTRALFAVGEPPPLGPDAAARARQWDDNSGGSQRWIPYDDRCRIQGLDDEVCEGVVPLARVAPAWGQDAIGLDLEVNIGVGEERCQVRDRRSVPLPAGRSLKERVQAALRGGLDLTADAGR